MRVVFAIKNLAHPGGGAEKVLAQVASGLAARDHAVSVLTFDAPGQDFFYPMDGRVHRLAIPLCPGAERLRGDRLLRALPRIRRAIAALAPDVVVPFMHSSYVPVAAALAGSGLPVVLSEHAPSGHFRDRPVQRLLTKVAEKFSVAKTVPSPGLLNDHTAAMRDRVFVMPNPVDVETFAAAARATPASPPVLLGIGRFRAEKNFIDLVSAFGVVAKEHPHWRLRLVGDGEERGRIEAEVDRLDLRGRVTLVGMTQDPSAEYALASIVAIPSFYESFGLVAAEALASARPVISFQDCLGVAEIVEEGRTGLLVKGGTRGNTRVGSLADGLDRLMADPALCSRLGGAGPASVERYRLDRAVDRWETMLQSVAKGAGALAQRGVSRELAD